MVSGSLALILVMGLDPPLGIRAAASIGNEVLYYLGQKNRIIINRVHLFRSDSTFIMIYEVLILSMSPLP